MASSSPAGHPAPDCPAMVRSSLHSNASCAQPSLPTLTRQGSTNCAQDWASLSQPLLGHIFAVALEGANNDSAEGLVRERQHLALVCKAWKYVAEQVSVCALLSRPAHVGAAARAWLQRRPVEALALHPDLLDDTPAAGLRNSGFFLSLLGGADFAAQSRMHLRTLPHAGVEVLPALAPFRELRKLHLSSNDEQAPLVVDTRILGTLTKLHCLSITGARLGVGGRLACACRAPPGGAACAERMHGRAPRPALAQATLTRPTGRSCRHRCTTCTCRCTVRTGRCCWGRCHRA